MIHAGPQDGTHAEIKHSAIKNGVCFFTSLNIALGKCSTFLCIVVKRANYL